MFRYVIQLETYNIFIYTSKDTTRLNYPLRCTFGRNWKSLSLRLSFGSVTRFFAIRVTKDSGHTRHSQIIINRASLSRPTKLVYHSANVRSRGQPSLGRISLINYRDKDQRVNENDLPFNDGACVPSTPIDRSIDRSSLDRSRASLTKKERRRTMENASRTWIVGGASGFVPDHRQLFDSVRSLQSRFNDRHRSRSFSATSRARNARSNVLPRTTRRSTFTHSPTRAPRSSNFHPRCIDRFQEDSSQLHHSALTRIADQVTSKSNLSWK